MSNLSEEEIINNIKKQIENTKKANECGLATKCEFKEDIEALQGLLDLYNKEKETSHFLQNELDKANAKIVEHKKQLDLDYVDENYVRKELYNKEKEIRIKEAIVISQLRQENQNLKEKLQMYIPRRRVRRVYKMLGKILRTDIDPVILEKELKEEVEDK